jgi:hypothetical protein
LIFPPKKPAVTLVAPSQPEFSWNQREGWQVALHKAGISVRVLQSKENDHTGAREKLWKSPVVVFLNDHHLEKTFLAIRKEAALAEEAKKAVWISIATERVDGSPFPRSREKTELGASLCQFTAHFDRTADPIIRQAGSVPIFIHQYVDHHTFRSRTPFPKKTPGLFWTGKLPSGHTRGEYNSRTRLFETVRSLPGFSWREAYKPSLSIQKTVAERDQYQGLLHLPSNCPGYTSTFFENLATGGCVLQYDAGPEYKLPDLRAGEHYLSYDTQRPESLLEVAETFLKNPAAFQKMAEEGQRLCLQNHTIEQRLLEIFQVVASHLGKDGIPGPDSEAGKAVQELVIFLAEARKKPARLSHLSQ